MVSAAALPLAHLSGINRSKPMTIRRQINVSLVAIVGEGLLSRLSFGLISFTLPLYARHLGLSLAEVGVLAALNSAVAVGLKPFAGWAADRFGLKRIYLVSIGIRSLVSFFLGFATAPWELFAIRSVHGLSMSLRDPSANALIAEHGGEKSVASAFAWYQTARTVAGSMSRAFAGILLTITGAHYSLVFLVAFALSVLPLLSVARYLKEDRNEIHVQRHVAVSSIPSQRFEADLAGEATPVRPKVLPFVGLGFLIAASAEMLNGLFPVLATEYAGLSQAQTGVIYAVSTCAIVFGGPAFGWLSDNVSRKLVLTVRGVANTLSSIRENGRRFGKGGFSPGLGRTHGSGLELRHAQPRTHDELDEHGRRRRRSARPGGSWFLVGQLGHRGPDGRASSARPRRRRVRLRRDATCEGSARQDQSKSARARACDRSSCELTDRGTEPGIHDPSRNGLTPS